MEADKFLEWLEKKQLLETSKKNAGHVENVLSKCLGVKKGDEVILIGDTGAKQKRVAPLLCGSYYFAAKNLGLKIKMVMQTPKYRGEKASESVSLGAKIFKQGWGWKSTGIVIGLIAIAAFYTSTLVGRSYPLAITGGYLSTAKSLIMGQNLMTWLPIMVMATIVGAFLAVIISGEFKLRAPAPKTLIQCFIGGCLMGFGAVCSGGCNITHILSGVPQLALSSMLGGAFIILGCWAAAWWMFLRPMRGL